MNDVNQQPDQSQQPTQEPPVAQPAAPQAPAAQQPTQEPPVAQPAPQQAPAAQQPNQTNLPPQPPQYAQAADQQVQQQPYYQQPVGQQAQYYEQQHMPPQQHDPQQVAPQQYFDPQQMPPQPGQPPLGYATQPAPQQVPQPDQQQPGQPPQYHVHHSYVWLGSVSIVFSVFIVFLFAGGPVALSGELASLGGGMLALVGVFVLFLLIVGAVIGYMVLSWKHLYFELGEKEFSLYSGILNKKRIHIPYQRVQSVNQRASLIQRLLGVCTVNIDTAGGAANKAVTVPYLQNFVAEWLRAELFSRKQFILSAQASEQGTAAAAKTAGRMDNVLDAPAEIMNDVRGVFGGGMVDTGVVTYEYGLSNKELFFTGLSNNTGAILAVSAAIASIFGVMSNVLETGLGRYIYNEGVALATSAFADQLIWFVVGSIIAFMAVIWLFSIVGTCISYGGFKAKRRGTRIEVEHGLLQHRFHGVDIDRVQSVIIKQSFIRRLIGYCELSLGKIDAVEASSKDSQEQAQLQQGIIVHPFVKMSRVPEILAGLTPEFADVPTEQIALPKVSKRRALIRRVILHGVGFWLAIITAVIQILANNFGPINDPEFFTALSYFNMGAIGAYILCAIIMVLNIIGALMWFKGSSFAYNRRFMQITNGGFSRASISFPRKKIQFGFTRSNPLQRGSRVATINARTAAGVGGTTVRLLDVDEKEAEKWLDWVRPGQSVVE